LACQFGQLVAVLMEMIYSLKINFPMVVVLKKYRDEQLCSQAQDKKLVVEVGGWIVVFAVGWLMEGFLRQVAVDFLCLVKYCSSKVSERG
jgi:hypothetical protein